VSTPTPAPAAEQSFLLEIRELVTEFHTEDGLLRAVDGVSITVPRGGKVGLIGESGCGKSVTALSILRLIPEPPGRIRAGRIIFEGVDLLTLPQAEMRRVRGNRIAMIFQEPMSSLNPVFTVGDQISEVIRLHQGASRQEAWERAVDLLRKVQIPDPERRAREYPGQLSGGMCQRVMIAMALSCHPRLLIADEPSTALDVTIQAQILELMQELVSEMGMSLILITHDLGVVAETVDYLYVMYTGKVVEEGEVKTLFRDPLHPYTRGLLASLPGARPPGASLPPAPAGKRVRLRAIPGLVPSPLELPPGCPFQDRCPQVKDHCRTSMPELLEKRPRHLARCFEV
jgi:oligopeptide/dipeptide ABC transporter ATP-binding protein